MATDCEKGEPVDRKKFKEVTGFSQDVVWGLARHLQDASEGEYRACDALETDIAMALTSFHQCGRGSSVRQSWESLTQQEIPKTTWDRHVDNICDAFLKHVTPWELTHHLRLCHQDSRFKHATCIVDGFPVYSHGPDELYSGKKRTKCRNLQAYIGLGGVPLSYTRLRTGATHDSESAQDPPWPNMLKWEVILADGAYGANRHCLIPYRKNPKKGGKKATREPLPERKKIFNKTLSHRRARIERFFAHMCRHLWLRTNKHHAVGAARGVHMLWVAEQMKWLTEHGAGHTKYNHLTLRRTSCFNKAPSEFAASMLKPKKGAATRDPERMMMSRLRDKLAEAFEADPTIKAELVPRLPAHCSKADREKRARGTDVTLEELLELLGEA